jgi:hypothetical protein
VKDYKLAGIGFVLLLASLSFVFASLLKYGFGIGLFFDPLDEALMSDPEKLHAFNLLSPIVFLGGLGLVLHAYTVVRLYVSREDGAVVGTVRLRMKPLNITVVAVSSLLLITLLGYTF